MTQSDPNSRPPRPRLTDSPWFWVYLFGVSALAGLLLIGPKFSQRQARLESKQAGRESAWKHRVAGQPVADRVLPDDDSSSPMADSNSSATPRQVPLWPLAMLLTAALVVAWGALLKRRAAHASAPP